ncbi:hypothetical protein Tco_1301290 [Tanacetum coccineum]
MKLNTASWKRRDVSKVGNMALLSMRARKFYQRTGRKIVIDGSSTAEFQEAKQQKLEPRKLIKSSKIESLKPVSPSRKSIRYAEMYRFTEDPRGIKKLNAVLMRTGLKTVKNAKPLSTARSVNTVRPASTASQGKEFNAVKPSQVLGCGDISTYGGPSLTLNKYKFILMHEADPKIKEFSLEDFVSLLVVDKIEEESLDYKEKTHQDMPTCFLPVSVISRRTKESFLKLLVILLGLEAMQRNSTVNYKMYGYLLIMPKGHRAILVQRGVYRNKKDERLTTQDVKSPLLPTDLERPLVKDSDAEMIVDEHLYRSMIGSLMYLTASRPDIMFLQCVNVQGFKFLPTSHLLAVKKNFRYLKGKPSLVPLEEHTLEVVNYVNRLDLLAVSKKQLRLPLLQLQAEYSKQTSIGKDSSKSVYGWSNEAMASPKQTTIGKDSSNPFMAGSLPKTTLCRSAEASTDDNGEVKINATIDGHSLSITEGSLRRHLKLADQDGITSIPTSEIFEQLALMGYHTDSDKLTFQKGAFSPQWRFLIHNILHCLSPKKTAWEQFSSNIAAAIICLATNRKFNFSRMIFEHMVSNISSPHKFLMYPRFIQICLDMQRHQLQQHTRIYPVPSLSMKVFSNMKRSTKGFSGQEVALFPNMLDVTEPSTSPSRITSSPSPTPSPSPEPTPAHTPTPTQPSPTQPSPTQPSPTQPSPTQPGTEHHLPTPHDSPLHAVHSHGSDEGSLKLQELMNLVTTLSDRIGVLEADLMKTKKTYSSAYTKLILRVKKLESQIKIGKARRQARVVLSDDEVFEDDSSKQGRKLSDEEVQEKASTDTELFIQEVTPTEVIQDQEGSEKASDEVSTAGAKKGTASEEVPIVSTAEVNLSTAGGTVTYSRRSAEKRSRQDKGKAIMIEEERRPRWKLRRS